MAIWEQVTLTQRLLTDNGIVLAEVYSVTDDGHESYRASSPLFDATALNFTTLRAAQAIVEGCVTYARRRATKSETTASSGDIVR
jgi:hypothetical protein